MKYIRDAIDGILSQRTAFPVEILIHDDASTDGTADIIREYEGKYPNIIKPIYQNENQYSKKRGIITKIQNDRAKGKYIAKCEGDDYWTDPYKLQKQVEILEKDLECGMVFSSALRYSIKENKYIEKRLDKSDVIDYKYLLYDNVITTLTVCIRKKVYDKIDFMYYSSSKYLLGDYIMWLEIARISSVVYMDDCTGVYRYVLGSTSHNILLKKKLIYQISILKTKMSIIEKYKDTNWLAISHIYLHTVLGIIKAIVFSVIVPKKKYE